MNVNLPLFHAQATTGSLKHLQRAAPGSDLDSNHQVQKPRGNSLLTWDTEKTHLRLYWQSNIWPEELSRQAPGKSSQDSSYFHTPVHPEGLKMLTRQERCCCSGQTGLPAERLRCVQIMQCGNSTVPAIVQDHTTCTGTHCCVIRQGQGDVDDPRLHHGRVSMERWDFFVESLLRIVQRKNKDSVHAFSLEQGPTNLFCKGTDSKQFRLCHLFCHNYSTPSL